MEGQLFLVTIIFQNIFCVRQEKRIYYRIKVNDEKVHFVQTIPSKIHLSSPIHMWWLFSIEADKVPMVSFLFWVKQNILTELLKLMSSICCRCQRQMNLKRSFTFAQLGFAWHSEDWSEHNVSIISLFIHWIIQSLQHLMDFMLICAWRHLHFVSDTLRRQCSKKTSRDILFSRWTILAWNIIMHCICARSLWSAIYQTSFTPHATRDEQISVKIGPECIQRRRVAEGRGTISGSPSIVLLSSLEQLRWGGSAQTGWDWNTWTESLGILHCSPFSQTVSLLSFAFWQEPDTAQSIKRRRKQILISLLAGAVVCETYCIIFLCKQIIVKGSLKPICIAWQVIRMKLIILNRYDHFSVCSNFVVVA